MPNVMVTGPSSGIGREVSLALARLGFHVIAAGRSPERVGVVVDRIVSEGGSAEYLHLDLTSLASARQAAATFENSGRKLDVLINNAGIGISRGITGDGFQLQFGVNHLGHFMLFQALRRTLAHGARIVQVASEMHQRSRGINFAILEQRTPLFGGIDAYSTSKLANVLFARELARRMPEWRSFAVHPGMVDTGIFPAPVRPLIRRRLLTPAQGAETIVWCATEPELADTSGGYFWKRKERDPSAIATDDDLAAELWGRSERWCGMGPVN